MQHFDYNNIIEFDGILEEILFQDKNTLNGDYLIRCTTETMKDFCTNRMLINCKGILSQYTYPVHIMGVIDDTSCPPSISIISSSTI